MKINHKIKMNKESKKYSEVDIVYPDFIFIS